MKLNAALGNINLGTDWDDIRRLVHEIESAGFDGISSNDHVVGGHPDRAEGQRLHTSKVGVHEPLIYLSFIAAVTQRLEVATAVLLLPQRQTTLVAKQCAQLDLLSGGRLRLGVGVGRNHMEYEALGEDFTNRGRRIEEQVRVLRQYWTNEHVTFDGQWHELDRVGLNPMPVQQPIPIWMGSFVGAVNEKVIERIGRMADGWMPQFPPDKLEPVLERVKGYARDAGRDPADLGVECVMRASPGDDPSRWTDLAEAYRDLGATHLKVFAEGESPSKRVASMRRWFDTVAPAVS
jgi:probable F420-dependent oxidoreductase